MNSSIITIIITSVFVILTGIISLIDKVSEKEKVGIDEKKEQKRQKRIAWGLFSILLTSSVFSVYTSVNSSRESESNRIIADSINKENRKLTDSLINTQAKLIYLSNAQLDTSNKIIQLNENLVRTQTDLNLAQGKMIELQDFYYDQISGGDNKPRVYLSYSLVEKQEQGSKVWVAYEMPQLRIENTGKTYIKNIQLTISDEAIYYIGFEPEINYSSFFPKQSDSLPAGYVINVLPPGTNRVVYSLQKYTNNFPWVSVDVLWNNGSYRFFFSGKFHNHEFYLKELVYAETKGGHIDEKNFFHSKLTIPWEFFVKCPSFTYDGASYDVFYNQNNKSVNISPKGSTIDYPLAYVTASSPEQASILAKRKMIEVFERK